MQDGIQPQDQAPSTTPPELDRVPPAPLEARVLEMEAERVRLLEDMRERRRTQEALRRSNERLELLFGATRGLLASDEPRVYVRRLFDALSEKVGVELYFNFLVGQEGDTPRLHLDSWAGVPDAAARDVEWLDMGAAVCGTVAAERRARVVDDVQASEDPITAVIRSMGVAAYASFPLISGDRLVGTLSFGLRSRTAFTPDEVDLLEALAQQVAVAIDRARGRDAERRARLEAEQASEAKTQFLSTLSHELRTPMNAVIGLAELLESGVTGPVNARQREHLQRIQASAWHLVTIIEEILGFSRSEAGKDRVDAVPTDVSAIAREVVALLEWEAESEGLSLEIRQAEADLSTVTDPGKVRQVVTNLVGNALKYTDEGRVEVELDASADWLLVRVADTGRGIAADRLEDIFEPFVQIDGPDGSKVGGTGLGLAVSRRLARMLGGDVDVESEPGRGSTFTLRLPRSAPSADPAPLRASASPRTSS